MRVHSSQTPDIELPDLDLLTFLFGEDVQASECKKHIRLTQLQNLPNGHQQKKISNCTSRRQTQTTTSPRLKLGS